MNERMHFHHDNMQRAAVAPHIAGKNPSQREIGQHTLFLSMAKSHKGGSCMRYKRDKIVNGKKLGFKLYKTSSGHSVSSCSTEMPSRRVRQRISRLS